MRAEIKRWHVGLLAVALAACSPVAASSPDAAARASYSTGDHAIAVDNQVAEPAVAAPNQAAISDASNERVVAQELAAAEYPTSGRGLHDAVPDGKGWVWYTDQAGGTMGGLNPTTGETVNVPLGQRSAPHGIILGPDGAAWITDGGQNAIVRVDLDTLAVSPYPLPGARADLNTATFDRRGILWYTGQAGYIGRLNPADGVITQVQAPRGRGPYGIATAPDGTVYFASLAGSYLGRVDNDDGAVIALDPPTPNAGVRRVWADSRGRLWVSEYNAGQVGRYDPATGEWQEWRLPGSNSPRPYGIYVDHQDKIWLSDHALGGPGGNNTLVHFDPDTETFTTVASPNPLRLAQLGGVPGEVWGVDRNRQTAVVVRY
jgi:virginiamycin B lyase